MASNPIQMTEPESVRSTIPSESMVDRVGTAIPDMVVGCRRNLAHVTKDDTSFKVEQLHASHKLTNSFRQKL
jgi:hypothetical protein